MNTENYENKIVLLVQNLGAHEKLKLKKLKSNLEKQTKLESEYTKFLKLPDSMRLIIIIFTQR